MRTSTNSLNSRVTHCGNENPHHNNRKKKGRTNMKLIYIMLAITLVLLQFCASSSVADTVCPEDATLQDQGKEVRE